MKWIALPFLLLAIASASAQQMETSVASDVSGLRIDPDVNIHLRTEAGLSFPTASAPVVSQAAEDVCYTMHVIQFEARDGESPRRIGEATCTPAKSQLKLTKRPPRARFIPTN